jgi:hypothetical protein
MGCGAYGASVAGPGFGTPRGEGSGGSAALGAVVTGCGAFWAPAVNASAVRSRRLKANPILFLLLAVPVPIMSNGSMDFGLSSEFDKLSRLYH